MNISGIDFDEFAQALPVSISKPKGAREIADLSTIWTELNLNWLSINHFYTRLFRFQIGLEVVI